MIGRFLWFAWISAKCQNEEGLAIELTSS
uniref:Uncharacterized protein n=1 Tax=Anguilla anguilla TaxID=7936 RepID=A0A0E9VW65_ANGAN